MTPTDRIAQHREMIDRVRGDIEWIRESSFSLSVRPGETTEALIVREEEIIKMYEGFIAKIEADNA